jgi:hypothetical protein
VLPPAEDPELEDEPEAAGLPEDDVAPEDEPHAVSARAATATRAAGARVLGRRWFTRIDPNLVGGALRTPGRTCDHEEMTAA